MTSASSPRYDDSIRFACDCTVSSSQIRTPSPSSLIGYCARLSSSRARCPRGPEYVGGWTAAPRPSRLEDLAVRERDEGLVTDDFPNRWRMDCLLLFGPGPGDEPREGPCPAEHRVRAVLAAADVVAAERVHAPPPAAKDRNRGREQRGAPQVVAVPTARPADRERLQPHRREELRPRTAAHAHRRVLVDRPSETERRPGPRGIETKPARAGAVNVSHSPGAVGPPRAQASGAPSTPSAGPPRS